MVFCPAKQHPGQAPAVPPLTGRKQPGLVFAPEGELLLGCLHPVAEKYPGLQLLVLPPPAAAGVMVDGSLPWVSWQIESRKASGRGD